MKNLLKLCSRINYQSFCYTLFLLIVSALPSFTQVWTYDLPGGSEYSSPDYTVSIEQNGKSYPSFVYYSYGRNEYKKYSSNNMQRFQTVTVNETGRTTVSHSTAIFSFTGAVTVRVTIHSNAKHITLPLTSARVLPSSYDIPCRIENGNTIVFTIVRPEKVAIIANYDAAWKVFVERGEGHVPIQNRAFNFTEESNRSDFHGKDLHLALSEGYKNPLFIMALPPEKHIPDKNSPQTLVVNPGDKLTQGQINQYKTVWFKPGVHDLSKIGSSPLFTTMINSGQTFYLEGGSYVMARVKKNLDSGADSASIIGRGMISGIKHEFVQMGSLNSALLIHVDNIKGVSVTDRSCFGIHGGHHIEDVAMLGAWHGNNDGPDFLDDCFIKNCFLQAHDDNLKLNNNTHAKHIVIWQNENAHPIMVKEMRNDITFSNCIVEDVDILAHFRPLWNNKFDHMGMASIACVNSRNIQINNFTYRNIRIESPYIYRVFSFYNLDSNQPYAPGWLSNAPSSELSHTRINGVTFENITVTSPVILFRSLLGSAYENSMSDIRFINLNINGTVVTEKNKDEFFEIEYDKIKGLTFLEKPAGVFAREPQRPPADMKISILHGAANGITDIDGNVYRTLKTGNQVWMTENLKVRKFNDGTPIPNVIDNVAWSGLSTYAYCWYGNDSLMYSAPDGALYNWYVIDPVSNGGKNVCPVGWHVSTDEEWTILTDYSGGLAGSKQKEAIGSQRKEPDTDAAPNSGPAAPSARGRDFFSAGGYRYGSGFFHYAGYTGYWWSAYEHPVYYYWDTDLRSNSNVARYSNCSKKMGFSVRCVKDQEPK